MESTRRVVVIMPVYNEAPRLPLVLESLAAQTFPHERMFLIVVDGASNDGSASIVCEWLARCDIAGSVLTNNRRKIPTSLNLALQHVTDDDIVIRIDAHTICANTYISDAVRIIDNAPPDIACIGNAAVPAPGTTFEERLVEALYTNPLGLGSAASRVAEDVREVDSVYLGVWRPGILSRMRFNESMEANEDGELAARVRRMGFRILRVPLACRFLIKRGMWASIRQFHRYGYFRAKMLQRNPQFVRIRHVAPPVALLLLSTILVSPLRIAVLPLFALYAAAIFRLRQTGEPLAVTVSALAFFPLVHLSFATGMLRGLVTGRGNDCPPSPVLPYHSTEAVP